jgi:hypothetical protein
MIGGEDLFSNSDDEFDGNSKADGQKVFYYFYKGLILF